jgi:pyrroloquinoline quinone biosynthesis protein E
VCDKSPFHQRVQEAVDYAQIPDDQRTAAKPLVFRDPKTSRQLDQANFDDSRSPHPRS